jgi:tetratricopeptide (TPR) repeat protein
VTSFNALKFFYKLGAQCCFAKALYQECVHTLLEALKFNPEDPELWCLYAKVFIMKKSFEYARPMLQKALLINPDYTEAKELLEILSKTV